MPRPLACAALFLLAAAAAGQEAASRDLTNKAFKAITAKDFPAAAKLLEQAVAANPRNAAAHGNLGYVLSVLGRTPDALAHSEKAVALDPKAAFAHVNAAVYASALSDFTKLKRYGASALAFPAGAVKPDDAKLVRELLDALRPREYTITWTLDPADAWGGGGKGKGPFFTALPDTDLPFQTSSYAVRGTKSHATVTRDGVTVLKFDADGPVTLTATTTVRFVDYRPKLDAPPAGALPDDARAFLGPGPRLDPTTAKVKAVADAVRGDTPRRTIDNLIAWLKGNMTYEHPTTFAGVDEILARGTGDCGAYSAVFAAVCRANGIPAREVWGVVKATTRFAPPGHLASHVWAEAYLDGPGWVPVEPQNANGLGHQPTGYVRLMHLVTDKHEWPPVMRNASNAPSYGKAATTPPYTEKLLPE